jgi:antitoxin HigA-1
MIRVPTDRPPTHPGELLIEEFLAPMGITQRELADAIHVPYQRINEIVNGRRGITPGTALRLAKFFGMSADFWLNMQLRWDLYHAQISQRDALKAIRRYIPDAVGKEKSTVQGQPPADRPGGLKRGLRLR